MPNRKGIQFEVKGIKLPILARILVHFYEEEKLLHSKTQIEKYKKIQ